ncbi:Lipoprotein-releasing system ATP-binding protein LolD [Candidatus Xenohaliotis californiensis]|uniref:Lipoprotein-releasing system ATP-binding protein LolD n=1 Tax=Candidatus Xenohaliotis californiensis TaxID=84677 RepID=A0ABM9N8M9_9RICK|nr:Lipoprotein-releasing system ATP-binding protein LolD [Candidatus Xenohaliotis californiensis]
MNIAIELKNVSKSFDGIIVLNEVNLKVKTGEIVSICGNSGSGKTTLLQIIGTLDNPSSGQVFIDGINQADESEKQKNVIRGKKIGFIYQFHHLLKEFSVLENVMMPLLINKTPKISAKKKALEELMIVGLESKMNSYPSMLSGGERQRAAIARAMVHCPKIIIADEPTGNLDPSLAAHIFNILCKNAKQKNSSIVLATHNHILAQKADRVLQIQSGKLSKKTS